MTTTASLMIDISSNNAIPNLRRLWKAGRRTIALKATESTTYTWDQHARLADKWHKRGGNVWHYHFARPANIDAQVAHFLAAVKDHWEPGDQLALDVEVAGVGAGFVERFIEVCHRAHPDWPGLVYSYPSFLTSARIKPSHGWGLWLATYGTIEPKPVAGWDRVDAWQFTDRASVPGEPGRVDDSRLFTLHPAVVHNPVLSKSQRRNIRRLIASLRRLLRGNR